MLTTGRSSLRASRLFGNLALSLALVGSISFAVTACGDGDNSNNDGPGGDASGGNGPGGSGSGGDGTGGSEPGACEVTITNPTDGSTFDAEDDADGDQCSNGFQRNVTVSTDAEDGSVVELFASGEKVAEGEVDGGRVVFEDVQLEAQGATTLVASVDSGDGCEDDVTIEVDCGLPTCSITKPVLGPSHPKLNGVPVVDGGDRTSSQASPYQTSFEVTTDIADGQPVVLHVAGETNTFSAVAQSGVATFSNVTLDPDDTYTLTATCFGEDGLNGISAEGIFEVDTAAPSLTVHKDGSPSSPLENGDHFGASADSNSTKDGLQFQICGATASSDALDLPGTLGSLADNFCVAVGSGSPVCAPAVADGGLDADGACVEIDCPGGGLFSVTTTLNDDAGNVSSLVTANLTCASTAPQVQLIDPIGDAAPYADVTKRILAANNGTATRRDKTAGTPGAQYDVRACTTVTSGTARLLGGLEGDTPGQLATGTIVADAAGACPSGAGWVGLVTFADVTLPESSTKTTGGVPLSLDKPTQLVVEVTDPSDTVGTSPAANVWIDSTNPSLNVTAPSGFCGSFIDSSDDPYTVPTLTLTTQVTPVAVSVNGGAPVQSTAPLSFGSVTMTNLVQFSAGTNQMTASTVEPSGNAGALPAACQVEVGTVPPPVVTWSAPLSTNRLTASATTGGVAIADGDAGAAGWQGALKVCTNVDLVANPGATVQFSIVGGGDIGSPAALVDESSQSCATLSDATVPEGIPVQIRATTSEVTHGPGTTTGVATISVPVDVTVPTAITDLTASVLNRRATSFRLVWSSPGSVSSYRVRVADTIIDTPSAFSAATSVNYSATPSAAGNPDGVDVTNRLIERDQFFAVAPVDAVGNVGPSVHTTSAVKAQFQTATLNGASGGLENFGAPIDGSTDLNGDGFTDVVVGNLSGGTLVRVFVGSASGFSTTAAVTLTGVVGFGTAVAVLDLSGDSRPELVVGSPGENRVYVYNGRASWPSSLASTDANTVLAADTTAEPLFSGSSFGGALARLGDFNGDGRDDLAIGAPFFDGGRGLVAVLLGKTAGHGTQLTFPGAFAADALRLEGPPGVVANFGRNVTGLGSFFAAGRSDLLVAAPFQSSTAGSLYAFSGRAHTSVTIYATEADSSLAGGTNERLGNDGFTLLGPTGPGGQPAFGLPLAYASSNQGRIRAYSGTVASGPFASLLADLRTEQAPLGTRPIGRSATGGGFSGTSTVVSFLRGSSPDLIVPSKAGGSPKLFLLSGETLATVGSTLTTIENVADVTYPLTGSWADFGRNVTALRDVNGDGYGDIAVSEANYSASTDGKVLVLY